MEEARSEKEALDDVEIFRTKNLLKRLSKLQGTAGSSSVITLILPPGEQVSRVSGLLTNEYGTASNIKSRVTRSSVLDALTSAQHKLKLYSRVPKNGLVVLCGNVEITSQGGSREKRLSIAFEPPRPTRDFVYKCDNSFHLESVLDTLEGDGSKTGIIVTCGEGALFAILTDSEMRVITEFQVELPKKHGRGGQSKLRFERLAQEARDNFIRKTAETANRVYILHNKPAIDRLLLSGNGSHKRKLGETFILDYRLREIMIGGKDNPVLIDTSYGFQQGLQETLNACKEVLKGTRFEAERDELENLFAAISLDKKDVCYGIKDTLYAMTENLASKLYISVSSPITVPLSEIRDEGIRDEVREASENASDESASIPLIEYAASYAKRYAAKVVLISDSTAQGEQFLKGFGGIAGRLRYDLDVHSLLEDNNNLSNDKEESDDDDVFWS